MKRRASLFAASLKKMEHQNESENNSETPSHTDKDIAMEIMFERQNKEKEQTVEKYSPKERNNPSENGIEKEGKNSQREITSLNRSSESSRNIEKKNEIRLNSKVDVEMPEISIENIVNNGLASSGVPKSSRTNQTGAEEVVFSSASEKEVKRNSEVNGEIEVKTSENQNDRKEKKRKAEKDMDEDIKIPEVKKLRTGKIEEETRSSWEESMNET